MKKLEYIYLCNSEKELISCQKYFRNNGYRWQFNDKVYNYHDLIINTDPSLVYNYKPIVISLSNEKTIGWSFYEDRTYLHFGLKLNIFNNRKNKLERLLNDGGKLHV